MKVAILVRCTSKAFDYEKCILQSKGIDLLGNHGKYQTCAAYYQTEHIDRFENRFSDPNGGR
jgi:hypothetical protein